MKPKIKHIVTALGVGSHLTYFGFDEDIIDEADWNTELEFDSLTVHILPARHFSGRSLQRNRTLWAAFALLGSQHRIFISGDSGYGRHFKEIGEKFGGFDLAAVDTGQYNDRWPLIHMNPEEASQAALDVRTKGLIPAHVGKFALSSHDWDEPFIRLTKSSLDKNYRLLTPIIGEPVYLGDESAVFPAWWENVDEKN
jgi:L-ascorbate metabolism protein UlaG (beta-lactamase superfamily)